MAVYPPLFDWVEFFRVVCIAERSLTAVPYEIAIRQEDWKLNSLAIAFGMQEIPRGAAITRSRAVRAWVVTQRERREL